MEDRIKSYQLICINSSKVYCKLKINLLPFLRQIVLIVAKCIVNVIGTETGELREMVLIVAKCIVNLTREVKND